MRNYHIRKKYRTYMNLTFIYLRKENPRQILKKKQLAPRSLTFPRPSAYILFIDIYYTSTLHTSTLVYLVVPLQVLNYEG